MIFYLSLTVRLHHFNFFIELEFVHTIRYFITDQMLDERSDFLSTQKLAHTILFFTPILCTDTIKYRAVCTGH